MRQTTIGILGAGQLGRMLALAGYPLGLRFRLLDRVALLTLDDLYAPDGMSAVVGQPVAPLILGIYEHYEEHAHEFEQLCASLGV